MFTFDYRKISKLPGLRWLLHISIGDIVISSFFGLILHLFVEVPAMKIIELLFGNKPIQETVRTDNKVNIL